MARLSNIGGVMSGGFDPWLQQAKSAAAGAKAAAGSPTGAGPTTPSMAGPTAPSAPAAPAASDPIAGPPLVETAPEIPSLANPMPNFAALTASGDTDQSSVARSAVGGGGVYRAGLGSRSFPNLSRLLQLGAY